MSKNYFKKFSISILAVSALTFGALHNDASASFWDWFKIGGNSEQAQPAEVGSTVKTYKWVNDGSVSKSDSRPTGECYGHKKKVTTYTCNSSTLGNKLFDGTNKGTAYGDTAGHAWPIYEGENTSTATEYTYDSAECGLTAHNASGTVNEWECKLSDSTTASSSSSSNTTTSSSSSSGYQFSTNLKVVTNSATSVTSNSATLNGTINPKDENVVFMFYYVKSGQPDTQKMTSWKSVISGSSDVSVSANVTNLSSDTTYRFAVIAYSYTSKKFTRIGGVQSFTTPESSTTGSSSSSSSVEQYTLKVKISGAGKVSGGGISCAKTTEGEYKEGSSGVCSVKINKTEPITQVTLVVVSTPSTQYEFATWADDCRASQGVTSCVVKMGQDRTVSATFNKKITEGNSATVSARKTGEGEGKIISVYSGGENSGKEDGRINCGTNCSENYKQYCDLEVSGDRRCGQVYFKAVPEKGSTFGGWGNCLTFKNEKDQCYIILDGNKTITANFDGGKSDLTVVIASGYGNVKSTDGKIDCSTTSGTGGSDCKESYNKNGTVTLKATPSSGYAVASSPSGCNDEVSKNSDGSYTCKVKMTKNQNVTVNFKKSETSSSKSSSVSSSSNNSSPSSSPSSSISSSAASANHTATTGDVTNKTSTSGTLNGTVNSGGETVYYIFAYKKSADSSWKYSTWQSAGSGSSDVSVIADISGLSSGTTYNYLLSAYSYTTKKYAYGKQLSFTTSSSSTDSSSSSSSSISTSATLTPKTGSTYNVTSTSARLLGTVNPQGENVSVYFQYRKSSESSDMTKTTILMSTGSISGDFNADISVSSLSPETTYIYRFYAKNNTSGKIFSGDSTMTFKTLSGASPSSSSVSATQNVIPNTTSNVTTTSSSSKSSSSSKASSSSSSSSLPTAFPLNVSKVGTGVGLVSAPGINCPSDCGENYPSGFVVNLNAKPAAGSIFAGWTGCTASNGLVCAVLMNTSKSVIANFVKP